MVVYDTRTWQPVQQIALDRPVETLAVNRNGSVVYTVITPTPAFRAAPSSVLGDGNTFATGTIIVAFDVATGQIRAEYKREREQILRMFVTP
jgi:outer membrane protein assembly factor BamB